MPDFRTIGPGTHLFRPIARPFYVRKYYGAPLGVSFKWASIGHATDMRKVQYFIPERVPVQYSSRCYDAFIYPSLSVRHLRDKDDEEAVISSLFQNITQTRKPLLTRDSKFDLVEGLYFIEITKRSIINNIRSWELTEYPVFDPEHGSVIAIDWITNNRYVTQDHYSTKDTLSVGMFEKDISNDKIYLSTLQALKQYRFPEQVVRISSTNADLLKYERFIADWKHSELR